MTNTSGQRRGGGVDVVAPPMNPPLFSERSQIICNSLKSEVTNAARRID